MNRYRASKQADVLMFLPAVLGRATRIARPARLFLRATTDSEDGGLLRLQDITRIDFSAVVHSWVLARRIAITRWHSFGRRWTRHRRQSGRHHPEGIPPAALAGSVDLVQRCFTGLETRCDRLILSPNCPESLGTLEVPLRYRGGHPPAGQRPERRGQRRPAMRRRSSSNVGVGSNNSRRDRRSGLRLDLRIRPPQP